MNKTIVNEENSNLMESMKTKNGIKVDKINPLNDCNGFSQQSSTFSDSIYDIYDDTPKKTNNSLSNGVNSVPQNKKNSKKNDANLILHLESNNDRLNGNDNKHNRNPYSYSNKNSFNNYGDDDADSETTQARLDEIMRMCADFERHNHPVHSPPFVQNRIKTNGSLPREKKSPFSDFPGSVNQTNVFFPPSPNDFPNRGTPQHPSHNSGYENVRIVRPGQVNISNASSTSPTSTSSSSRYENVSTQKMNLTSTTENTETQSITNGNSSASKGYENVFVTRKSPVGYVPQSPRTKIKTCISPKKNISPSLAQRKTEYESMVKSFEEKLRLEIQQIRENRAADEAGYQNVNQNWEMQLECSTPVQSKQAQKPATYDVNDFMNFHEKIPSIPDTRSKNINNLTINIKKNLDEKQIFQLKRQRADVLQTVRLLRSQISELQRQEDEISRGMDLEKALVTAEISTERKFLEDLERHLATLQAKIHRLEAQRNANRVLQETQQNKLKQAIDVKRNQVDGLEKLIAENSTDELLKSELNQTFELLENDTKTFEDLEFQYLEEETEWLGYRDELYNEQKTLTKQIDGKSETIHTLEQGIDNQSSARVDTKSIQKNVLSLLNQLEKSREELNTIDTLLFQLSGQDYTQSDSDEEYLPLKQDQNDIMSQSFSGSQEFLAAKTGKQNDLMSKSMNENLFSNKIEMPSFNDGRCYQNIGLRKDRVDNRMDVGEKVETSKFRSNDEFDGENSENTDDPLLKLKYNLSPPFERRSSYSDSPNSLLNLNLSIESDNFQVNQLETRVPSQDDIDRICKVTTDAPMSTQGASLKVIKSIKEIERNRQLLLAQQGSHIIEYERQKMNDLRKEIHDEAKNQYLNLQTNSDERKKRSSDNLERYIKNDERFKNPQRVSVESTSYKEPNCTPQRHSHPDLERERPLSKASSEISYDVLSNKSYKSSSDVRLSTGYQTQENDSNNSQRNSYASNENKDTGRMVSGSRRNLPKHQRPLTRYLPILSADLNLRLHIESAGHQINLCPNVVIDSYSCRGYLHKLGATFHGWSRRWFVLDRQKMALIYYLDKSERKPRGGAYFSTIDEVYLDHLNTSKSGRPHCTFIVKTKKRSFHLLAASDATARIWIDAIITGAQGNIDY